MSFLSKLIDSLPSTLSPFHALTGNTKVTDTLEDKTKQAAGKALEITTSPSTDSKVLVATVKFETKITWGDSVYRVWTNVPADVMKDEASKKAYEAIFANELATTLAEAGKTSQAKDLQAAQRFDLEFADNGFTATTYQPTNTPGAYVANSQKITFTTPEQAQRAKTMKEMIEQPIVHLQKRQSETVSSSRSSETAQISNSQASTVVKSPFPFLKHDTNSCFLAVAAWTFLLHPDTRAELRQAKSRLSPQDQEGPKGKALDIINNFIVVCDSSLQANKPVSKDEIRKLRGALSLLIDRTKPANQNRFLENSRRQEDASEAIALFRELIFNDQAKMPSVQKHFIFNDNSFAASRLDKNPGIVSLHLDSQRTSDGNLRVQTDRQGQAPKLENLLFTHHWDDKEIHEYKRGSKTETVKEVRTMWTTYPDRLDIQLNRFIFDITKEQTKKIEGDIDIPLAFTLDEFHASDKKPASYQLDSVVLHNGSEANNGHYIAIVRRKGEDGKMHNFLCDDCDTQTTLRTISDQECERMAKGAYKVTYKKVDPSQIVPSSDETLGKSQTQTSSPSSSLPVSTPSKSKIELSKKQKKSVTFDPSAKSEDGSKKTETPSANSSGGMGMFDAIKTKTEESTHTDVKGKKTETPSANSSSGMGMFDKYNAKHESRFKRELKSFIEDSTHTSTKGKKTQTATNPSSGGMFDVLDPEDGHLRKEAEIPSTTPSSGGMFDVLTKDGQPPKKTEIPSTTPSSGGMFDVLAKDGQPPKKTKTPPTDSSGGMGMFDVSL